MKKSLKKLSMKKIFTLVIALAFIFNATYVQTAAALDPARRALFGNGVYDYDPDAVDCNSTGTSVSGSTLTPEQEIAQTLLVGFDAGNTGLVKSLVSTHKLGGVFFLSGGNTTGLTKAFFDELNTSSVNKLFVAADDEGGRVALFGKGEPSAASMAGMSRDQVKAIGARIGKKMADAGLTGNLAPVLDIATGGTPWGDRDWSSDPNVIADKAGAFAEGMQESGITVVYKHFPGIGKVTANTDNGPTAPQNLSDMTSDLAPYKQLLGKGKSAVMLSNGYINEWGSETPVGMNAKAVEYLRKDLSYNGLIMTDALNSFAAYGSKAVDLPTAVANSLNAGVDMPLFVVNPGSADATIKDIIAKVSTTVSKEKVHAAYLRTLTLRGISTPTSTNPPSGNSANAPLCCGTQTSNPTGGPVTSLVGDSPKEKFYNYFIARGLTPDQTFGFMGNVRQESGFQVDNQQNTRAWPTGGWGLVQWTNPGRRDAIVRAMQEAGIGDLYSPAYADGKTPPDQHDKLMLFQLDYIWKEFETTHKGAFEALKAATTLKDASTAILGKYEIPGNWQSEIELRAGFGEEIKAESKQWKSLGGGGPSSPAQAAPATGGGTKTVVALDPGHGGEVAQDDYKDPASGIVLADRETPNSPEREDVLEVAKRVKAELETAGYEVVLLRNEPDEKISKFDRVKKAKDANAQLAVSIHTAPNNLNEVWPQRVGKYREYNSNRLTFSNEEIAKKSQQYTDIFAKKRTEIEGHSVTTDPNNDSQRGSFTGDRVPSQGDISLLQLWSDTIPWVYNEIGQDQGTAISEGLKQKYAAALVASIKEAVPSTGTGSNTGCAGSGGGAVSGDLSKTTLAYAWPTYKGNDITPKPEWKAAFQKAKSEGRYIGGTAYPGIDCGGFVTNLLIDSGFEPKYNWKAGTEGNEPAYHTPYQYKWLRENWQSLGMGNSVDPATLRPGDVAIRNGHTYIFVGKIEGFASEIASASLDQRAPMADTAQDPTDSSFEWFRKK